MLSANDGKIAQFSREARNLDFMLKYPGFNIFRRYKAPAACGGKSRTVFTSRSEPSRSPRGSLFWTVLHSTYWNHQCPSGMD